MQCPWFFFFFNLCFCFALFSGPHMAMLTVYFLLLLGVSPLVGLGNRRGCQGIELQVVHVLGKCLIYCTIALASLFIFVCFK